jgi:hypothetical protein
VDNIVFRQVPLPDHLKFRYPHFCIKCKTWFLNGILSYSEKLEKTVFICFRCQPIRLIPAPLPKKTQFRKRHECIHCQKKWKVGVITFCSRCEEGEFVCPFCLEKWFNNITPDDYGYDERADRMR